MRETPELVPIAPCLVNTFNSLKVGLENSVFYCMSCCSAPLHDSILLLMIKSVVLPEKQKGTMSLESIVPICARADANIKLLI